jgi:hypothetical protein
MRATTCPCTHRPIQVQICGPYFTIVTAPLWILISVQVTLFVSFDSRR